MTATKYQESSLEGDVGDVDGPDPVGSVDDEVASLVRIRAVSYFRINCARTFFPGILSAISIGF
jgi:hypothetical protein